MVKIKAESPDTLEGALSSIESRYGKGALVRLGDREIQPVEVISTGSIALDVALGVGGIPRGRITELYGQESSGKCLSGGTYVFTENGLLTIEEIFESQNLVPSCTTKTTEHSYGLVNRWGEIESTTHFTNNGRRPVFKLTTNAGSSIESTARHPHLVMSENGNWTWRKTENLKVGDVLVEMKEIEHPQPSDNFEVEGYLLGVLVADGHFEKQRVQVTNDDPDIKAIIENEMPAFLGTSFRKYKNNDHGSFAYHFASKEMIGKFYSKHKLQPGCAKDKIVPLAIRTGSLSMIRSFLQGYMDCESSVDDGIEVTSASHTLLVQVQLLLKYFGVGASINKKTAKNYPDNDYWRLYLSGANAARYADSVGFLSALRQNSALECDGTSTIAGIPNIRGLLQDLFDASETTRAHNALVSDHLIGKSQPSHARLAKILTEQEWADCAARDRLWEIARDGYSYKTIVSIEEMASVPTFDFAMEKTHSFIANGFVTHNTTLALHMIANAQRDGGRATFIDAEHALDPQYAAALGVDLDNLYLCQPDCGEQALEIADTLIKSGSMAIVVIDSVAALVPQAELNGEMGDAVIGLQARLMSQAMRKITGSLQRSNTALVFTNQLREKVGVMFGSPVVTSGGKALKFYASVRLDIARIETLKTGTDAVGSRTRVKVVKNKVGPPFKTAEFDILWGEGISMESQLLDIGGELGIVKKSGAWYTYGDTQLGQGKDRSREFIKDNPGLATEILDQIKDKLGL